MKTDYQNRRVSRLVWLAPLLLSCMLTACSKWNVEPKEVNSNATQSIYSQGQVIVRGANACDLDAGITLAQSNAPADFYWNVEPVSSTVNKVSLFPSNGARFVVTTFDQSVVNTTPSTGMYIALTKLTYSENPIVGGSTGPIRAGVVVAYKTDEGRYGMFRVDKLGTDLILTLTWITFPN